MNGWARYSFWLCVFALVVGCGSPKQAPQDPEKGHVKRAASFASEYFMAHEHKMPESMDEVKEWAKKEKKAEDADFVSTRDEEPYVLIRGPSVALREKIGKDGLVYVAGQRVRGSELMSIEEAEALASTTGGRPAAGPQRRDKRGPHGR
ncbi:MAG TPA: hypothetical protein VG013_24495 [Gemmataceae bacterium]|jgi:hypothetical protein|nr:hypothetical protein [Gemmataceae bacterium]